MPKTYGYAVVESGDKVREGLKLMINKVYEIIARKFVYLWHVNHNFIIHDLG